MAKYQVQKQRDGTWSVSAMIQGETTLIPVAQEHGLKQEEVGAAAEAIATVVQANRQPRQVTIREALRNR